VTVMRPSSRNQGASRYNLCQACCRVGFNRTSCHILEYMRMVVMLRRSQIVEATRAVSETRHGRTADAVVASFQRWKGTGGLLGFDLTTGSQYMYCTTHLLL
jgi:hypothetical protein